MGALLPCTALPMRSVHDHIVQIELKCREDQNKAIIGQKQCKFQYFYYQRHKRYKNTVLDTLGLGCYIAHVHLYMKPCDLSHYEIWLI